MARESAQLVPDPQATFFGYFIFLPEKKVTAAPRRGISEQEQLPARQTKPNSQTNLENLRNKQQPSISLSGQDDHTLVSKFSVFSKFSQMPVAKRRDPDCGSPFFG